MGLFLYFLDFFSIIVIFIIKKMIMNQTENAYYYRDYCGRVIIVNLIETKGGKVEEALCYDSVDLLSTGLTCTAAIEVKDRSEKYMSTTIEKLGGNYIMKKKYDRMNELFKPNYDKLFFAVVFKDFIYLWDITDKDFEWEWKYLPNTTVEDTGYSWQQCSYLHLKDAVAKFNTKKYKV